MKHMGVLLLLLGAVCLMEGCTGWMNGEYSKVEPHVEVYANDKDSEKDTAVIRNFEELTDLLVSLVTHHTSEISVDVSRYDGAVELEMKRAIEDLRQEHPLVSYALAECKADFAEIGARRVCTLNLSYRRSAEQIESIQSVWGVQGMKQKINMALDDAQSTLVLRASSYGELDVETYVEQYYGTHMDDMMELPRVTATVYPDRGSSRIIEINFQYTKDRETLLEMRREVEIMLSSAAGYVRGQTSQAVKAERLYSFLRPLFSQEGTTSSPVHSLLCTGVGDSYSMATVYNLLCQQVELECQVVQGTKNGEPWSWNVICLDGIWCHVDLMADLERGELTLRSDQEMKGYTWDRETTPVCPTQETQPAATEATEPETSDSTEPQEHADSPSEPETSEETTEGTEPESTEEP